MCEQDNPNQYYQLAASKQLKIIKDIMFVAVGYSGQSGSSVPSSYTSMDSGQTWDVSSPPTQGNYDNYLQGVFYNLSGSFAAVGCANNSGISTLSFISKDFGRSWSLASDLVGSTGALLAVGGI